MDVVQETKLFIATYGARPSISTDLGKSMRKSNQERQAEVRELVKGCTTLQGQSIAKADRLITAVKKRKVSQELKQWASSLRCRGKLRESQLSRAIQVSRTWAGQGAKRLAGVSVAKARGRNARAPKRRDVSTCKSDIVVQEGIPLSPAVLVNWLYQCLGDVWSCMREALGTGVFNHTGLIEPPTALGELTLMWGSHLFAVRDQALGSYDYDVDLAVFLAKDVPFDEIWELSSARLRALGYRTAKLDDVHYRVFPKDPICWNEYTEMKYHLKYQKLGLDQGALAGAAKKACAKGNFVAEPHGQNYIDLEVYHVQPGKPLRLHASKPYAAPLRTIFPTIRGIFGPLALMVPATIGMLQHEYSKDCMSKYRAKIRGGAGPCKWIDVPSTVRRTAWPSQSLARVDHLLCFR